MRYFHFNLRFLLVFFATLLSAQTTLYGQKLSIGVTGGVALTDLMGEVISSEARRYTFGPILEIRLPASFAAEISALYRRTGFTLEGIVILTPTTIRVRANSWEFPLLVKYYVARQSALARPYISGGYVLRYLSNVQETVHTSPPPLPNIPPSTTYNAEYRLHSNPSQGIAIGGGLSFKAGPVHIAPGIRYTGWFTVPFDVVDHGFTVKSARNQVDLLVAVTF